MPRAADPCRTVRLLGAGDTRWSTSRDVPPRLLAGTAVVTAAVHVQDTRRAGTARDAIARHRRGRRRRDRPSAAPAWWHQVASARATAPAATAARTRHPPPPDARSDRLDPLRPVQVMINVSGGTITEIVALQLPSAAARAHLDVAEPTLHDEALAAQSAAIDGVSGATYTSRPTSRACRPPSTRPGSERRGDPRRARHGDGGQPRHARRPGAGDDRGCRLRAPPRRGRPLQHLSPRQRDLPSGPGRAP